MSWRVKWCLFSHKTPEFRSHPRLKIEDCKLKSTTKDEATQDWKLKIEDCKLKHFFSQSVFAKNIVLKGEGVDIFAILFAKTDSACA